MGPNDWCSWEGARTGTTGRIWGQRGFLGLENYIRREYSGWLCLDSTLGKKSHMTYDGGLFLVNCMQQCFYREQKALFSQHTLLVWCRIQIHSVIPSTVGYSNFSALTSSGLYQTTMHLIIFCTMWFSHGFLGLNIISSTKLEPLPRQEQCLIFILHFLLGFSKCWVYDRSLNMCWLVDQVKFLILNFTTRSTIDPFI